MLHARYVGSDKRSLGGTWQRIKPPSRFATVVPTICDNRKARFVNMWDMSHIFVFSASDTPILMLYINKVSFYIPHPVFFLVPSQLVSSLVEPPPPVLIPPLPPAARVRISIMVCEMVMSWQNISVQWRVRSCL